jgi:hypothetical protein
MVNPAKPRMRRRVRRDVKPIHLLGILTLVPGLLVVNAASALVIADRAGSSEARDMVDRILDETNRYMPDGWRMTRGGPVNLEKLRLSYQELEEERATATRPPTFVLLVYRIPVHDPPSLRMARARLE